MMSPPELPSPRVRSSTLFRQCSSLLIPTRLPVISNTSPCYLQQASLFRNNRENGHYGFSNKGYYFQQIGRKWAKNKIPPCYYAITGKNRRRLSPDFRPNSFSQPGITRFFSWGPAATRRALNSPAATPPCDRQDLEPLRDSLARPGWVVSQYAQAAPPSDSTAPGRELRSLCALTMSSVFPTRDISRKLPPLICMKNASGQFRAAPAQTTSRALHRRQPAL